MSQADLCRLTGIQSSQVSQYESGKRDIPRENAMRLVLALRGSLDYLFLGSFDRLPQDLAESILRKRRNS